MRHKLLAVVAGIIALLAAPVLPAQDNEVKEPEFNGRVLQELYAGVVVDQTVTVVGHEFYQHFAASWRDKEASGRYAITVVERPSARWGSQLWIEYAHRRVFQTFLPAARANIQAASTEAVELAFQNVVDTEVQRLLFRDPDIGADEI
jgi:curli production assembly/transport component CsgE